MTPALGPGHYTLDEWMSQQTAAPAAPARPAAPASPAAPVGSTPLYTLDEWMFHETAAPTAAATAAAPAAPVPSAVEVAEDLTRREGTPGNINMELRSTVLDMFHTHAILGLDGINKAGSKGNYTKWVSRTSGQAPGDEDEVELHYRELPTGSQPKWCAWKVSKVCVSLLGLKAAQCSSAERFATLKYGVVNVSLRQVIQVDTADGKILLNRVQFTVVPVWGAAKFPPLLAPGRGGERPPL